MNDAIKLAIEKGELILFLGAGASRNCKTALGADTLDGKGLAQELARRASIPYDNEELDDTYAAALEVLGGRMDSILEELFRQTRPSIEYQALAQFAWRRIYTLNIDDGLERAFRKSEQDLRVRLAADPIVDRDVFFKNLDLIKLNGSIDRLREGVIFSSAEYAKAANRSLPWYEQCASDFMRSPILFIGTKLNEPLLKFHMERFKAINGKEYGRSFVITPSATPIQAGSLRQFNIVHIPATLADFTAWLTREIGTDMSPLDLAKSSIPQYAALFTTPDPIAYADSLEGVSFITPDIKSPAKPEGAIRNFYKGFQPNWNDIVEGIPAELEILSESVTRTTGEFPPNTIIPFIGPAGSGKTTLLMQLCYVLCRSERARVYYIEEPNAEIKKTLDALESSSAKSDEIYVVIDNVDIIAEPLADALNGRRLKKTRIICAERENIWKRRTKDKLGTFSNPPVLVREFTPDDAEKILAKLQKYGSWTILGQMSEKERVEALVSRAQKQLLIALLEATYGRGFEQIIESDYNSLESREEKLFFLTVGIITERLFDASTSLVDRALNSLGILEKSTVLSENLAGIIDQVSGDRLRARHPIYVRHLLEHIVDPSLTATAISGILNAFSHYKAPVIRHLKKTEAGIYKGLINHKFLWEVLKGRETLIITLYRNLEKSFEQDGLFWLQYGLALRDLRDNDEALDKLRTAYNAYPMPHTQHALGQQLLILAEEEEDRIVAFDYVDQAKQLLEPLDSIIDSDDTYPIVTLAEGHTKIVRKIDGDSEAQRIAKSYIPPLSVRRTEQPDNVRVKECHDRLFKFAATGTWAE
ncbi:SIR2 family protein [Bordetella hinzii]|uniref:P-loop NTPase n=1 Tax=Bordetella hinzii TaxID=103855 RepID=UPI0012D2EC24|nr:SIR2 family protein [Bordetella hinzii]WPL79500.1 SIR2 family protein [Bordetella hinzii]